MVPRSTYSSSLPTGTPCQARHHESPRFERLANDMGGGFTFGGEIGGQNHLLHHAIGGPLRSFCTNVLRTHPSSGDGRPMSTKYRP